MLINIAIVEDDLQHRTSLKLMAESSDKIFCRELFEDAESLIAKFKHLDVDVILMDINLPGYSGIECVEQLKKMRPEVQFLMCTHFEDSENVFSALSVGATGYIVKNTTPGKLVEAIEVVYAGGSQMSPQIARLLADAFVIDKKNKEQINLLTDREMEVVDLYVLGYTYKEIASNLSLSINTIRTYSRNIYEKLQVRNKTEAINKLYPKIKR